MSTRTPGTQIQLGSIFLMDYDLNLLRIASITNPGGINPPGQGRSISLATLTRATPMPIRSRA